MNGHIYIAYLRESIKSNDDIYKIGKSSDINTRPNGYPKGSIFLFTSYVDDIKKAEDSIVETLISKMIQRLDYGKEYFQGDYKTIRNVVLNVVDEVNINSKIRFINNKKQLNIDQKDENKIQELIVFDEFVNQKLVQATDKKMRLKQSEIHQCYQIWIKNHPIYENLYLNPINLKKSIESVFGNMIESLRFNDGQINKGWKNIAFS